MFLRIRLPPPSTPFSDGFLPVLNPLRTSYTSSKVHISLFSVRFLTFLKHVSGTPSQSRTLFYKSHWPNFLHKHTLLSSSHCSLLYLFDLSSVYFDVNRKELLFRLKLRLTLPPLNFSKVVSVRALTIVAVKREQIPTPKPRGRYDQQVIKLLTGSTLWWYKLLVLQT